MNLPHIALIPYLTCNFNCSYCCANKFEKDSLKLWQEAVPDVIKFLNTLDKKMILVSGGEPLIWNGWPELIKKTDHYWYFATNTSVVPNFLAERSIKDRVRLFISAFHPENISVDKFIGNAHKLQNLGYAVFAKIIHTHDNRRFTDWEKIHKADIPVTFTPLVSGKYSKAEIDRVSPFCFPLFANRFTDFGKRKPGLCAAGTSQSFEIRCTQLVRCGLVDIPITPPKFIKRFIKDDVADFAVKTLQTVTGRVNPFIGSIDRPQFYQAPKMCYRQRCDCEWHTFSGMGHETDMVQWQKLIDTGKWN